MSKTKNRAFRVGRFSFLAEFICPPCDYNLKLVPIAKWAKENHYTVRQCYSLLRKKHLLGIKFKNRMFVVANPNWKQ